MFNIKLLASVLSISLLLSGCAAVMGPAWGGIRTNLKVPIMPTANEVGKKVGSGTFKSVLGIALTGEASIDKLTKDAGITKVSHIDYEHKSFMTFFAKGTIYVYGN